MTPTSIGGTTSRHTDSILVTLLLLTLAPIYFAWSWTDQLVGLGGDNAIYVLMAQYLTSTNDNLTIAEHFTRTSRFPPLYPLTLGLLGGAKNFLIAHQITTGILVLAFIALFIWLRKSGLPSSSCLLLVTTFALLPGTYTQALYLHSENLYLLLTMLTFLTAARKERSTGAAILLGLLAAGATLTRTAGISLIVALAIYLFMRRRPHRWITLITAGLPVLMWNVHVYNNGTHYLQFVAPGASEGLFRQIVSRLAVTSDALQYGWLENLTTLPSLRLHCLAIASLCLCGSLSRAMRGELDGLYVLIYISMMLLWPFPGEAPRFVFVIVPILIFHGTWLLYELLSRRKAMPWLKSASVVLPMAVALVSAPSAALAAQRVQLNVPSDLAAFKRDPAFLTGNEEEAILAISVNRAVARAMNDLRSIVQEGDCILAIKPSIVSLIAQRLAKAPPGLAHEATEFERQLNATGCAHALLLNMTSPTFPTPMYPWSRLTNRIEIKEAYNIQTAAGSQTVALIAEITSPSKSH